MDAMSKKEKLARGSAVIKVMRVNPRPGHFLKSYLDISKLPKKAKIGGPKGVLAEMPHLDVKNAYFEFLPKSARIPGERLGEVKKGTNCNAMFDEVDDPNSMGLPDGDRLLEYFGYRRWAKDVSPTVNGNIAQHFNIMLGLLISMAMDPDNENFPDVEAYPCVQFLKTVKTPEGSLPHNISSFIFYLEYVAQKMIDEG